MQNGEFLVYDGLEVRHYYKNVFKEDAVGSGPISCV